jgi:hypothetical protein
MSTQNMTMRLPDNTSAMVHMVKALKTDQQMKRWSMWSHTYKARQTR